MKTKNLVSLAVAALVVVLLTVLCLTGVQVGKYIVIPAADGITRGNDFSEGTFIVVNVNQPAAETAEGEEAAAETVPASEELYDKAVSAMKKRADMLSLSGVTVMEQGSHIRVEMPTSDVETASGILYTLTQPCHVYFTNAAGETVLEGENIASCQISVDSTGTVYYLSFKVEEEALSAWADMTEDVNEAITVYFDGSSVITAAASELLSIGMTFTDYTSAMNMLMALQTGYIEAELVTAASGIIPAAMTEANFDAGMLAIAVLVAIAAVVMIIVFKGMGVVSALSVVLCAVAVVFAYGLIPYLPFGAVSFFGFAAAIAVKVLCDIGLLSKSRGLMASGDLIATEAVRLAWRESGLHALEFCGASIVVALAMQYFGKGAVSAFTNVYVIGSVIALIVTVIFTRPLLTCVVDKAGKMTK